MEQNNVQNQTQTSNEGQTQIQTQTVDTQQTQQVPEGQQTQQTQQNDLIAKVSQFQKKEEQASQQSSSDTFDFSEIDKIQDPQQAKVWAEKAYKSMQGGFTKKFQELADLRKALETKLGDTSGWTPEKVRSLLNDQSFVEAAQSVAGNGTTGGGYMTSEEWSTLTEGEKAQFQEMQNQINSMVEQNSLLVQQQQDERLKSRYANYDPTVVNNIITDLSKGTVQATREHIWKIHDYDSAVQRAYEMGRQDRQLDLNDKINSSSTAGFSVTAGDSINRNEGESSFDFFRRIARARLAQSQGRT
jgi:hypothetical protein